jgi:hypothetical protein
MKPFIRKFNVAAHVTFSVGWLGADAGFLALAILGLVSQNPREIQSAYTAMNVIGWYVIVPMSFASLLTGLSLAVFTRWGLFNYHWIATKFVITTLAVIVLLFHTNAMQDAAMRVSGVAADSLPVMRQHLHASRAGGHLHNVQLQLLVASAAGLLVLLTTTALGVYKPWGKIRLGRQNHARS